MDDSNPYATSQGGLLGHVRSKTKRATGLMVTGFILLGIASCLFFFAQSFTFYTPYSTTTDWVLSLPNGMDYSIHSYAGLRPNALPCLAIIWHPDCMSTSTA